jgi:ribonuclease BN (tRNA processing enzyme)
MEDFRYLTVRSGTCVPDEQATGTCGLLELGALRLLIDAGTGTLSGLLAAGVDPLDLDGVLLTHHHPDHVGELPALLQSLAYGSAQLRQRDFFVFGGPATRALFGCWRRFYGSWVDGRHPATAHLPANDPAAGHPRAGHPRAGRPPADAPTAGYTVQVYELADQSIVDLAEILDRAPRTINPVLRAVRPFHTPASLAYRIDVVDITPSFSAAHPAHPTGVDSAAADSAAHHPTGVDSAAGVDSHSAHHPTGVDSAADSAADSTAHHPTGVDSAAGVDSHSDSHSRRSVVFSGDTGPCESLVELAAGADLLVVECSFPDGAAHPKHMTPDRVARLARRAAVKKILLHHFYPQCDPRKAAEWVAKRSRANEVAIAQNGRWIVV